MIRFRGQIFSASQEGRKKISSWIVLISENASGFRKSFVLFLKQYLWFLGSRYRSVLFCHWNAVYLLQRTLTTPLAELKHTSSQRKSPVMKASKGGGLFADSLGLTALEHSEGQTSLKKKKKKSLEIAIHF